MNPETKFEPLVACLNVAAAAVPGHVIKTAAAPNRPVAIIPEGGGKFGKKHQLAYAHLLASAPELLSACEALLFVIHSQGATRDTKFDAGIDLARAAIAKATGAA